MDSRFRLKTLGDLRGELAGLDVSIPVDEDLGALGEAVRVGDRTAPNRFVVLPMEGFDSEPDGAPGDLSFRRYRRYARGGFGFVWFEATAVLREARSNAAQLYLHDANVDAFARLVDATRKAARAAHGREPVMVLQLTHSGRYSKPSGVPEPIVAHHSEVLDPKHDLPPDYALVTDEYLDRLQDTFVNAAKLAARAGFDGVDVKSCHGYLISELHASFTREGKYGGAYENRTRMLRETLARIGEEAPGLFITTRMNAYDAIRYPYGFGVSEDDCAVPDLREPIRLARDLAALGVPVLNVSLGNPYVNPHYGRPYGVPACGAPPPAEHPLQEIARFVEITRAMQEAVPEVPVVSGGYAWLRHLMPYVAAGVVRAGGARLIGQGRGAFAYPDSVNDILTDGRMDPGKCCIACSGCTRLMREGVRTGCVVRDREVYGGEGK